MQAEGSCNRWWEGGVIYHVYVRSWQDSDGDGSGDLPGVIKRLDYLEWLGVDGVWLSPTMPSPDADWGYDVADYLGVHPELGTLDDLDRLVAEAGARNMRIVLDLVPNHTSSAHEWFVESCASRDSAKREWYVWADPRPDGGPPNNWRGANGESAWTLDPASGQLYLHNFLPAQPDLNWWNPEVHKAFEDILRFWFDRGIAGFRIDVAHGIYKDSELRDDPVGGIVDRSTKDIPPSYSKNRPEVHGLYREWRKLSEERDPPALLLGETWVSDTKELARFYGDNDELHLGFNFVFLEAPFTAAALSLAVASTLADLPAGACPVWVGSNHDVSRFPTRWAAGDAERARLALTVLCTLPGTVVLYYGDELGLTDVRVANKDQRDEMRCGDGNRDRSRTPMPWNEGPNYGFTTEGVRSWLPLGDRQGSSVREQRADECSMLWLARRLLQLRRAANATGVAAYEQMPSGEEQWIYRCGSLIVAANMTDGPATVDIPEAPFVLSSCAGRDGGVGGPGTSLVAWEAVVLESGTNRG